MSEYKKILEFAAGSERLLCAYGANLPAFESASIYEDARGDCIMRCRHGGDMRHYRVEKDGHGRWVFLGGRLLLGARTHLIE